MSTQARTARVAIVVTVVALAAASLFIGGYDITLGSLFAGGEAAEMFSISRIPRTLALIFAAVAMGVSGVIMQMITQNKFVEPTTAGTSQWAGLGVLTMLLLAPGAPPLVRMVVASVFALFGTLLFLTVLRRVAVRGSIIVPLVGIMMGAVVGAVSTFLAGQFNLLQSMSAWRSGGFSSVVEGFYEPLWAVLIVAALAWFAADRFTVAGLGEEIATNVGLNYNAMILWGTGLVAVATGVVTVVVGNLPFLGLIVPNVVSIIRGDDLRSNLPWVCLLGIAIVTICDIVGRTIIAPFEVPVSLILGIVGAVVFIALLLRQRRRG